MQTSGNPCRTWINSPCRRGGVRRWREVSSAGSGCGGAGGATGADRGAVGPRHPAGGRVATCHGGEQSALRNVGTRAGDRVRGHRADSRAGAVDRAGAAHRRAGGGAAAALPVPRVRPCAESHRQPHDGRDAAGGHRTVAHRRSLLEHAGLPAHSRSDDGGRFPAPLQDARRCEGRDARHQRRPGAGVEEGADPGGAEAGPHRHRRDDRAHHRRVQAGDGHQLQGGVGIRAAGGEPGQYAGGALHPEPCGQPALARRRGGVHGRRHRAGAPGRVQARAAARRHGLLAHPPLRPLARGRGGVRLRNGLQRGAGDPRGSLGGHGLDAARASAPRAYRRAGAPRERQGSPHRRARLHAPGGRRGEGGGVQLPARRVHAHLSGRRTPEADSRRETPATALLRAALFLLREQRNWTVPCSRVRGYAARC